MAIPPELACHSGHNLVLDKVVKSIPYYLCTMSVTATELGTSLHIGLEDPLASTQSPNNKFPKAEEVRGPDLLSILSSRVDEDAEIPSTLKVRAIRSGRHWLQLRRGDKLPKPEDRIHYRVKDAIRQLTPDEDGIRVTGRNESGERIKPISIFVNHDGAKKGNHKVVYSTMGDLEARPHSRTQRRQGNGRR